MTMTQSIKQNGVTIMTSPDNASCNMIFRNLTGLNFGGEEYRRYVRMMLREFSALNYGEIELWEGGKCKCRGNVKQ